MMISPQNLWIYANIFLFLNFCSVNTDNGTFSLSQNIDKSIGNLSLQGENIVNDTGRKLGPEPSVINVDPMVQAKAIEDGLKNVLKSAVKQISPILITANVGSSVSRECTRSVAKYINALRATKVWAVKMLDATAKLPAGLLVFTMSDFGSFDECLEISVPKTNGDEEFRGAYCAVVVKPDMAPLPENFSLAHHSHAGPHETISAEILKISKLAVPYFQFGICIPSACTIDDAQSLAVAVGNYLNLGITVPKCYVMEETKLEAIHILMIFVLTTIIFLAVIGTILDVNGKAKQASKKWIGILLSFSVNKNSKKLMMISSGPPELKALHGIRALCMAWVILSHVYLWPNFRLLGRAANFLDITSAFSSSVLTNGWLCVDSFFLLSGLLLSYSCIPWLEKTKGKLNIVKYIFRRYIRLTPATLVVMGLIFFLPLITSGPFLYEQIDREIESCRNRWWLNLLYISNWFSVEEICIHTTWYLAADFQLYILSLLVLFSLYRSAWLGYFSIGLGLAISISLIGIVTYLYHLQPTALLSSGNEKLIMDTVNLVYIRTFTHLGPYFIGLLTGFIILKYKDAKISKKICCLCWCLSFVSSATSIYGIYQWNSGHSPGLVLTVLYAAVHRITFTIGVAWVAYACASGRAGVVNWFLSLHAFVPISRLTFAIYLIHALVVWARKGSERERIYFSHYNMIYEWIADCVVSIPLAFLLHLLVEAPVSNLERLIFSEVPDKKANQNF